MGSGKKAAPAPVVTHIAPPEPLPTHSAASITPTRAQQSRLEGDTASSAQLLAEDDPNSVKKTTNLIG